MQQSLVKGLALEARKAAAIMARSSGDQRVCALELSAKRVRARKQTILDANRIDLSTNKLPSAQQDRLLLTADRIEAIAQALEDIAKQPDPLHQTLETLHRPNGLVIEKRSVPLGVIGIIYESRPNVTADAGGLCIKSGNAALLRGGSESLHSSLAILECLQAGLKEAGLPQTSVQALPSADRAHVGEMLGLSGDIDVIIPRGGKSLIERVMRESRVPVLAHLEGNNHTYIHHSADPDHIMNIPFNAKMRRPGVCGATEKLLVDRAALLKISGLLTRLSEARCEIRGDKETCAAYPFVAPAQEEDWGKEYLAPILAVKIVEDCDMAIQHITRYGSHHTDAIIAQDQAIIEKFFAELDSAILLANASTQFADGGEFGMGAEIGIATGRLHARGPVGARELTTHKYLVRGSGQTRP